MPALPVKITIGPVGRRCRIEVGGQPLSNVRSVSVTAAVGDLTTVTIELANVQVEIEGEIAERGLEVRDERQDGEAA